MTRRMSASQFRSAIQQAQRQRKQQIDRTIRDYNNKVRQHNAKVNQAINSYNREVRSYNARVRANRARLQSYLHNLSRQNVTVHYRPLYQSTLELRDAYTRLDNSHADPFLSDLAERDTTNSVAVVNALLDSNVNSQATHLDLSDTRINGALGSISPDLCNRWNGAIYSLNPINPDASRHFCTSSREIITGILDVMAPDKEVAAAFPSDMTKDGRPTRRAKIYYCLERTGRSNEALERFTDFNLTDLNNLFRELNAGAHGPSGKFSLPQLHTIKIRVEDAIGFVCEVAGIPTGVDYIPGSEPRW